MMKANPRIWASLTLLGCAALVVSCGGDVAQPEAGVAQTGGDGGAPSYVYDPGWPKPLPNNWKMGGVTGLTVDSNDDVWVYNRPNDLTAIELHAEVGLADCCVRPPSMIHIDKNGDVIGSFDAPQGHGMEVDADGFLYLGQDTVRKYDPNTGEVVGEIARTPEREGGARVGLIPWPPEREPGEGGRGPVVGFIPGGPGPDPAAQMARAKAAMAFRAKYPPETPMVVGGLEEIRIDEAANEIYLADNYLGGRILVFDKDTFEFKRGWGAYGKPLSEISINDADHAYTPGGAMPADFAGHLTFNFSNDGLVYAADRNANRIHVTDKMGNYQGKEFILAPQTGVGGSTGGVAFSPDPEQRYLFISDLTNNHIWFLDRQTGEVVGQLGSMGDSGGQFFGLHMISVDRMGNIYTGEVFAGERVQRFVPTSSPRGQLLQQLVSVPLQ
jgi:DNA-binding beta-propeller fold protein YncE